MIRYVTFLFLLSTVGHTNAQMLPFKTFSTKEGLMDQQVTAVLKDDRGLLWVGTPFGLNWFDGTNFYTPPIKAQTGQLYITDFYKDSKGFIWILSFYNGIYRFTNGKFINFLPHSTITSNRNSVFKMLEYDAANYLAATDENLWWFNGKNFSHFKATKPLPTGQIHALGKLQNGFLLLGGDDGLAMYSRKKNEWENNGIFFKNIPVNQIVTHKNEVWIATAQGLFFYKTAEDFVAQNATQIYLPGHSVIGMVKAGNGDLWIASEKMYKIQNGALLSFDAKNGLPEGPSNVYQDPQGVTWFTSARGLSMLANEHYKFYNLVGTPLHSMIISLQADNDNQLWMGSYSGIAKKTANGFEEFKDLRGEKLGYISTMYKTKSGQLLAGTEAGLLQLTEQGTRKKLPIRTSRIFEDSEGALWIGTDRGDLYRFWKDSLQTVVLRGGVKDYIDGIFKDNNNQLWIGYRTNGIMKFALNNLNGHLLREFNSKTGFADMRIRCSFADGKGNILFGTRTNGLFIFSLKDNNRYWHINSSQGLAANWVKSITTDKNKNLYLATNKGVNVISNANYAAPAIRTLSLSTEGFNKSTNIILNQQDTLWIGTDEGIIQYMPDKDLPDTTHPQIYITQLTINGKTDSSFVPYSKANRRFNLPYDSNIIALSFAGVNRQEEGIAYRYMLEGQDKNWSTITNRNFVSYHLPPGKYIFKVFAINKNGVSSLQPAIIPFFIHPPFWQTGWFIFLIMLLGSAAIYFLYRYRLQQMLKVEKLRSKISTDLHDDIGSTLSSISILSEVAIQEKNNRQTKQMVKEIRENSISLMEKMDDIIWSVNPKNDSLENLMLRIKPFAAQLFEAKGIDYVINIDDSIRQFALSMENRQHVYLIMKEAINNIVKYSGSTKAVIVMKAEKGNLFITINDNGKGFDTGKIYPGNGIINMKWRAAQMNAELILDSVTGKGTTIFLRSKIK